MAYRMAGITNPASQIDFAEVDDTFSYKELQHLEALGLARPGESGRLLEEGAFSTERGFNPGHSGPGLPVNVSGGHLGCGYTHDMSGLRSVLEVVLQLRGEAGERQLSGVKVGLAQSWRGIPTATGAVAVLRRE
jgi:acetyl-CoA C-acetyltransferase